MTENEMPTGASPAAPGKKPWSRKKKWLVGGGVAFVVFAIIGSCAEDPDKNGAEPATASTPPSASTAESSAAPEPSTEPEPEAAPSPEPEAAPSPEPAPEAVVKAPVVNSSTVSFAESKTGLKVDAVDVGEHMLDDVNHRRGVIDTGNWRVVAQCENLVDGKIRAGVLKADETAALIDTGRGSAVATNEYKFLLDCPNG